MKGERILRKAFFIVLTTVLLVIGAPNLATTSKAGGAEYGIWIGNEQFTEDNTKIYDYRGSDIFKPGYAEYNDATKTITFVDFQGTKDLYEKSTNKYQVYSTSTDTIHIAGYAKLLNDTSYSAISYVFGNIVINEGADIELSSHDYTLDCQDLLVEGKLTAKANVDNLRSAIYCNDLMVTKDGEINASITGDGWLKAILSYGSVNIYGTVNATVNVTSSTYTDEESTAICCNLATGKIVLEPGCKVTANANGSKGVGIGANSKIEINNSDIHAAGTTYAIHSKDSTISLDEVYIKSPATAKLKGDYKYFVDQEGDAVLDITIKYVKFYDLWVGSTRVNDENQNDIPGIKDGSAKYDPTTKTLTFEGDVTGVTGVTPGQSAIIESLDDLTIKGNAELNNISATYGIYQEVNTTLTIDGDLNINIYFYGIYCKSPSKLIINGQVEAYSTVNTVYSKYITINKGAVLMSSINNNGGNAVCCEQLTVNGGEMEASASGDGCTAVDGSIDIQSGTVNIVASGDKTTAIESDSFYSYGGTLSVEVKNNTASNYYAVNANNIFVKNGNFTVTSSCGGVSSNYGVEISGGNTEISANNAAGLYISSGAYEQSAGTLKVEGKNYYGLYLNQKISIDGGTLIAKGDEGALISYKKDGIELKGDTAITYPYGGEIYRDYSSNPYTIIETSDGKIAKSVTIEGIEKYPVYVGEIQVTSANKDKIPLNMGGNDFATYDPETSTLEFPDNTNGVMGEAPNSSLIYANTNLTIKCNGKMTLYNTSISNAVYVENGDLTLDGEFAFLSYDITLLVDKNLNIYNDSTVNAVSTDGTTISCNNLYLYGALTAVSQTTGYNAIEACENIVFDCKALTVQSAGPMGVYADDKIDIINGLIESKADEYAFYAAAGITIADDMIVTTPEYFTMESDNKYICNSDNTSAKTVTMQPAKKYNVIFDFGGDGSSIMVQEVIAGKTAVKPEDPESQCRDFAGWYTDPSFAEEYDFTTPITDDTVIFGLWKVHHKNIEEVFGLKPTCTTDGFEHHYECKDCGAYFFDEFGNDEIISYDIIVHQALGHDYDVVYAWSEDGRTCIASGECKNCSDKISETVKFVEDSADSKITAAVKTPATTTTKGVTTYTAKFDNPVFEQQTKDVEDIPVISGETPDATPTPTLAPTPTPSGKFSSEAISPEKTVKIEDIENTILSIKDEKDVAGSTFTMLKAKAAPKSNKSIKLTWSKVPGAEKYMIFSNKCGKKNKYKYIATVSGTSYTAKKLKKGTYYKFTIVAVKGDDALAVSKTLHVTTNGGKKSNNTKVKLSKTKLSLGVGKSKTIKATLKSKKKVSIHRKVAWESDNLNVATVNSKGKITAVGKGTCYVYAYAQNGVAAKVKVTVK